MQIDNYSVALGNVQEWQGPLTVDAHDGTLSLTIWVGSHPADGPVKCDCLGDNGWNEAVRKQHEQRDEEGGQYESHRYR